MEKLYIAVKNGQLSLEDFNKLIVLIWEDGLESCSAEYSASNYNDGTGGWKIEESIDGLVSQYVN